MNYFENINESLLVSIARDLINLNQKYNLTNYEVSSSYKVDLWQGYVGPHAKKVVCEIKKSNYSQFDLFHVVYDSLVTLCNEFHPNEIILVVTFSIGQKERTRLIEQVRLQGKSHLSVYDVDTLNKLLDENPQIKYKHFPEKWYIFYDLLTTALVDHYKECNSKKKLLDPSMELLRKLLISKEFREENKWSDKLDHSDVGVDPVHVFASFSGSKHSRDRRERRLKIIFRALNIEKKIYRIDFTGCPSPVIVPLLSTRNIVTQSKIWEFFIKATATNIEKISEEEFNSYSSWRGLDYISVTIFLFWTNSAKYLSIDKHTESYLQDNKVAFKTREYTAYRDLLLELSSFNYISHDEYGSFGIYRELVKIAYDNGALGIKKVRLSQNLGSFFSNYTSKVKLLGKVNEGVVQEIKKGQDSLKIAGKDIRSDREIKSGFRVIAIKILPDINPDIKGVLKDDVYVFDNAFHVKDNEIEYFGSNDLELYTINPNTYNKVDVNVTALVGKNGSGKSTLTELIFTLLNNAAFKHREKLGKRDLLLKEGVSAELYYSIGSVIYCLRVVKDSVLIKEFEFEGSAYKPVSDFTEFEFEYFNSFIYTIALNYSIYSLNSSRMGEWIERLFRKNDGYQTPLVINPMRIRGNIEMNRENLLVKGRVLSNLLMPVEKEVDNGMRQLSERQVASRVEMKLIPNKNKYLYQIEDSNGEILQRLFTDLEVSQHNRVIKLVKEVFDIPDYDLGIGINIEAERYIVRKLINMSVLENPEDPIMNFTSLEFKDDTSIVRYLNLIKRENTHVRFKIKQAINYLKLNLWDRSEYFDFVIEKKSNEIEEIASAIEESYFEFNEYNPPPFFEPFIFTEDLDHKEIPFEKFSSGENQLIFSISTILYHLRNIQSVHSDNTGKVKYHNINLLLDEIELYYHPDLQRSFIDQLLRMLSNSNVITNIKGINIMLVTHSPFVLSDIMTKGILRLEEGKVKPYEREERTFGANIYDLLKDSFFLQGGPMGRFSKSKLDETVKWLNNKDRTVSEAPYYEKLISLIGEPILRRKLSEMFDLVMYGDDESRLIERKITKLEEEIRSLKSSKNPT